MTLHERHAADSSRRALGRACAAGALALLLAASLSACAPEPDEIAGAKGKDPGSASAGPDEHSEERTEVPEDAFEKQTDLPQGFPEAAFPLPKGAVIFDAGERTSDAWFVVLRAASAEEAARVWDGVISGGGFEVTESTELEGGDRSAQLAKPGMTVSADWMTQDDGGVLLSYDLERQAA